MTIAKLSTVWAQASILMACSLCPAAQVLAASTAPDIYTCTDSKGRKLTSDRPISECIDREQKILNPSGTLKATLGPALTAIERKQLDARLKLEQDERTSKEEEKKRDRALLVRYPSQSAHQKERSDALIQVNLVKKAAAARVVELQAERTKLTDEMAFYQKDPSKAPTKLRLQIDDVSKTIAAQERFLADQDVEIKRVNDRFDEELLRLTQLWRLANAGTAALKP